MEAKKVGKTAERSQSGMHQVQSRWGGALASLEGLVLFTIALALALSLMGAGQVEAVTLNPGDILIADSNAFGGSGGVIHVNAMTGAHTTVSSGGFFVDPVSIAIAANGDLLVVDLNAFGGGGGVIRVDPVTGVQTPVSSGGFFVQPHGIAIAANGGLLVADPDAFGGGGGVIRVDPVTGVQTPVSSGGFFDNPVGIAIATNGDFLVTDTSAFGGPGTGGVIRVNPTTGAQTPVSSDGFFHSPTGIAIAANGDLFIVNQHGLGGPCEFDGCGGVIHVDPTTGAQTVVSSGGFFRHPVWIAIAANGDLLVTDDSAFDGPCPGGCGGIIRVNPVTGVQTPVSSGGSFVDPVGIAIVLQPATVVIEGCNTGVPNTVFPSGVTISDLIAACATGASNHGQFVSCVAHVTDDLKKAGIITGQQQGAIQSCAAQAHIP